MQYIEKYKDFHIRFKSSFKLDSFWVSNKKIEVKTRPKFNSQQTITNIYN